MRISFKVHVILFLTLILGMSVPVYAKIKSHNIVIGSGCSSICINGECESTCSNKAKAAKKKPLEKLIEKTFEYSGFSKLSIKGFDAQVQYSSEFRVVLTEAPSLIDQIKVTQQGSELAIYIEGRYISSQPGSILILMPRIDGLTVSGNADVDVNGFKQSSHITFNVSGSADIRGKENIFDSASFSLANQADIDFTFSKVSVVNAVMTDQSDVALNFLGSSRDKLTARLAGQSGLEYCGDPIVVSDISGLADIEKKSCKIMK